MDDPADFVVVAEGTSSESHGRETAKSREFVGYIWIEDEPGVRLSVMARSPSEAKAKVIAEYGEGHVVSIWNEEDAGRPR